MFNLGTNPTLVGHRNVGRNYIVMFLSHNNYFSLQNISTDEPCEEICMEFLIFIFKPLKLLHILNI